MKLSYCDVSSRTNRLLPPPPPSPPMHLSNTHTTNAIASNLNIWKNDTPSPCRAEMYSLGGLGPPYMAPRAAPSPARQATCTKMRPEVMTEYEPLESIQPIDVEAAAEATPAEATPAEAPAPPAAGEPVHFTRVNPGALAFQPMRRDKNKYVVPLTRELLVVSPPVGVSPLVDDDGEPCAVVWLRATAGPFADFARAVEASVLESVIANKTQWLRKDVPDDSLRTSFKTFLGPEGLRVKGGADVAAFDADRALTDLSLVRGPRVRAVLSLRGVTFGKTEFGCLWRLVQVIDAPEPACLFQADPDPVPDDDDDDFV